MTNNDYLRSLRYLLNITDAKVVEVIKLSGLDVTKADITAYLKKEEEEGYQECSHKVMAHFLNGMVTFKRGPKKPKEGEPDTPAPLETPVTNNTVLKKLRVAFELKDTDIVHLIEKSGLLVTKTELSAFFRNADHRNFRECGDQFLRNLLKALTP